MRQVADPMLPRGTDLSLHESLFRSAFGPSWDGERVRVGDVQLDRVAFRTYVARCTACTAELAGEQPLWIARDWALAHGRVCPRRARGE